MTTKGDNVKPLNSLSSIYALSSNDNPGNLITHTQLKGSNFEEWAKAIKVALRAKKKMGFLTGSYIKPADDAEEIEDWWTVNSMIISWIFNTIEPVLRSTISYKETAKELWDDIQQRFSVRNGARIHQLKTEVSQCKQEGDTVMVYYGRIKKLWDDLNDYDPMPICTCHGCTCALQARLMKRSEEERVHQFLMGLNDATYSTVRSNIIALDPLPNINNVYSRISEQEQVNNMTRAPHDKIERVSLAAKLVPMDSRNPKGETHKGNPPHCTNCKRIGHTKDKCFHIIGFPESWQRGERGRGRGYQPDKFHSPSSGGVKANTVHIGESDSQGGALITADKAGLENLSSADWEILKSLWNTRKTDQQTRLSGKAKHQWLFDTGASHHMTSSVDCFDASREIDPCPVVMPNGDRVMATREGTVTLGRIVLSNVLFIAHLNCNLVSVSKLARDGKNIIQFTDRICVVQDRTTRMLIGVGKECDGLYVVMDVSLARVHKASSESANRDLWHKRLGHPSKRVLDFLSRSVHGLVNNTHHDSVCDICLRAKQTRDSFIPSENKASAVLELLHCDLWGPYREIASCGSQYFLTVVDDFSRAVWVFLLKEKKDVAHSLKSFFTMVERQFNARVKILRSDNGTEFVCLTHYLKDLGIIHQTSMVDTPQQNGRVERKHRHILNVARALRFQAHLPITFWGECVLTAGYLINRTPTPLLGGKSPYELLFGYPPILDNLRVFGCLCYAKNLNRGRDKFASRTRKCVFIGYPYAKKGWSMFDLDTREFFDSRDVVFVESQYPFIEQSTQSVLSPNPTVEPSCPTEEEVSWVNDVSSELGRDQTVVQLTSTEPTQPHLDPQPDQSADPLLASAPVSDSNSGEEILGRGMRQKISSTRLRDYITHTARLIPSPTSSSASSGTPYPISNYVNCNRFSAPHQRFLAAVTIGIEPSSYAEALRSPHWRAAMQQEIQALEDNGTWEITTLPQGKRALWCKWVYRLKYRADGNIERYKARLVVCGNHQIEGLDFTETFAPTVKMVTVRTFLAVAAAKQWELHQMDVHNAFLHGDLSEEVYMTLPPGFHAPSRTSVCRLRKSLYGLRQAPRCWFAKLEFSLVRYGFSKSEYDHSLFTFSREGSSIHVLVYVDDLVIAGDNSPMIAHFKNYICSCFHMKDLGKLKYFLGIEVSHGPSGLFLSQRKYALDIISETGLLGAKPASTPIEQNHSLALATGADYSMPDRYRRLVGRLIYLLLTRPELSYSIHILAQFMQHPKEAHWDAAVRVVRYLKTDPGQGLLFPSHSTLALTASCDADWASCPLTRRSLTAYIVFLGGSPISWKTTKQHTVSRSSAESEYRALAATTCEIKWLRGLLRSLGVPCSSPIRIFSDSQSALHIAQNPVFHERTKHIEVDCHFVRDDICRGIIVPTFVKTDDQLADILTKALGSRRFSTCLSKLGLSSLHAPT